MEIEGMIIRDLGQFDGVSKAGKPWKKHEWVLETIGQYPRKVKFTVFGERTNTVSFELGKAYVISVDVESREFQERWYTDVNCYAARPYEGAAGQPVQPGMAAAPAQPAAPVFSQPAAPAPDANPFGQPAADFTQGSHEDDLPF